MSQVRRRSLLTAAAAAAALSVAGCGLQPAATFIPPVGPGAITPAPGADAADPITVTSKSYTEQLVLGKIAVIAARAAGYEVVDLTNVPGSQPSRELLLSGEADVTYEYTGTAWLAFLGQDSTISDSQEMWEAVAEADAANGLTWAAPMPLNNTFALAVPAEAVEDLDGISMLSQIAELPVEQRTFCIDPEFNSRADGMNPMLEHYGLERGAPDGVPEDQIGLFDVGATYSALAAVDCNFGAVSATDGRIDALDLTVLEDDDGFFPAYNAAPVFHTESLPDHEAYREVLESFSDLLTNATMRELNRKVDVDGEEPMDVAFAWMLSEGLVSDPAA